MEKEILQKLPIILYKATLKIIKGSVCIENLEFLNPDIVESITGYKVSEIADLNFWFNKIHPQDKPQILQNLSVLETNKNAECEYRLFCANGKYIYVQSKVYAINVRNNIYNIIGFVDVTIQGQLQANLKQSLEMFRILSDESVVGVYMLNKSGLVYTNDAVLRMLGYNREEISSINPLDLLYDENDKRVIAEVLSKRFVGEKFAKNYSSVKFKRKDGGITYANLYANTIKFNDEYVAFGTVIDITEQVSSQQLYFALKEVDELIITQTTKETLLKSICEILVERLDFSLVSVGSIENNTYKTQYVSAKSQEMLNDFRKLKISVEQNDFYGKGTVAKAFSERKIVVVPNVYEVADMQPWFEYFQKHSVMSAAAIPIMPNDSLGYILLLHSKIANHFNKKYLDILSKIQLNIKFALEQIKIGHYLNLINTAIKDSSEWVVITDLNGNIEYVNNAVCKLSGYSKPELMHKNPRIFKSGAHSIEFYTKLWSTILMGEKCNCTFINKTKDGNRFYLNSLIVPIKVDGKVSKFVDLGRDITKEVAHLEAIENLSNIYATLSHVNQLLVHEKNQSTIFEKLVEIMISYAKFKIAYIAKTDENNNLYIITKKLQSEAFKPFLDFVEVQFKNLQKIDKSKINLSQYPAYKSIYYKRVYIINDISNEKLTPFNKEAKIYNINSCLSIPIIKKGKTIGILVGLHDKKGFFDKSIYNLFKEITIDLNYFLDTIEDNKWLNIISLAMQSSKDFVGIMDSNFKFVYVNKAFENISGYTKDELLGKHHAIFSSKTHSKEFAKRFYETLLSNKTFTDIFTYKAKNNKLVHALTTLIPYIEDDETKYYISVGKDMTQEKALYEKVDYLNNFDTLTSLPNRKSFLDNLDRFIKRAAEESKIGAVAVINPINFGNVNKAYGYKVGNSLLNAIGRRLSSLIRTYDVLGKLESDKFVLLLKDLSCEEDSLIIMLNIIKALSNPYEIDPNPVTLPFNAGVSLFPKDAKDPKSLLEKAELAVADAKEKGEGALGFFRQEIEDSAKQKLSLRYDIRKATINKEFVCYYQPYYNILERKIIGAECLLRWQRDGRIVSPLEFIPFLEETGLILDVEYWLKNEVVEKIAKRKTKIPISINISPISFKQRHFADTLFSIVKSFNIDPGTLVLEILERTFIENIEGFKKVLYAIKSQGIKVALDDFGTGYSSLSYLSELTFDYLKIDISFIRKILFDNKSRSIVETIVVLSHKLGIVPIAEGVEEPSQAALLTKIGCDVAQGYFFSKPIPEEDFELLLEEQL